MIEALTDSREIFAHPELEFEGSGKVRDWGSIIGNKDITLLVATDRFSVHDKILPDPIPGRGIILNRIAHWWFDRYSSIVPNHLVPLASLELSASLRKHLEEHADRLMIARKLAMIPIEAVVRFYIAGSGWKDHKKNGSICGILLPTDIKEFDRLSRPIFTPATKAPQGAHDINIDFDTMCQIVHDWLVEKDFHDASRNLTGTALSQRIRSVSLKICTAAQQFVEERGLILADTKFEFGLDENGNLVMADEMLTPDSSRYWPPRDKWEGSKPPSYDKQPVRDYVVDKMVGQGSSTPSLPDWLIEQTLKRYQHVDSVLR